MIDRDTFRWQTMEGEVLTVDEMSTKHLFNCAKMIFNALMVEWGDDPPIWYEQKWAAWRHHARLRPEHSAELCAFFVLEVEARGDLPEKYEEPYAYMVGKMTGRKLIHAERSTS